MKYDLELIFQIIPTPQKAKYFTSINVNVYVLTGDALKKSFVGWAAPAVQCATEKLTPYFAKKIKTRQVRKALHIYTYQSEGSFEKNQSAHRLKE